jgi:hypothetical protein
LDVYLICWFRVLFPGVSIAEEIDGVGDRGSGDNTAVDVQALLF